MPVADLLVENIGQLVTLTGPERARRGPEMNDLGIIPEAALAVVAGKVAAVGTLPEVLEAVQTGPETQRIDAAGMAVIPGFVDPHTHSVFAGDRAEEFGRRLAGASYLEILAAGGGILDTVRRTRAASFEKLLEQGRVALRTMLENGTTTVEVKSGYGLEAESELKQLRVIKALAAEIEMPHIIATFLGAHALPPEYTNQREAYLSLLCDELIPQVAAQNLAEFCDVFCEEGVFTIEESRRILDAGQRYGLRPKIHADEIVPLGGAGLAASLKAVSADHLCYACEKDLAAMAGAGTVAVLLPGTSFMLRHQEDAPARRMIDLGLPVALATDYNPGTCPVPSMAIMIGLACLRMRLTPAEALCAATVNAAWALGRGEQAGSLVPGKQADFLILNAPSFLHIPYCFGQNLVKTVVKDGTVLKFAEQSELNITI
ncbi:MAG TPA: imidazolonepropionase [Chloroflexia bacterium]|nr:imidazolonepropionase [Chloroflexia bacterium]